MILDRMARATFPSADCERLDTSRRRNIRFSSRPGTEVHGRFPWDARQPTTPGRREKVAVARPIVQRATRRRQGVKAGLDLSKILSAASSIPVEDLTMQAVADRLGVDRKAVNHHVSDRETLIRLDD